MIKALLNGILSMLTKVVDIVLTPINLLVANLFPDSAVIIGRFNNFVTFYFTDKIKYFFWMLPTMFRTFLSIYFTFVITYYTIYYSYVAIKKIFEVIQKVKLW